MAVFTIGALLVGGVLTYFGVSVLATLAHWVAVAGAFAVFAGLTYNIVERDWFDFIGFDSELLESLSAAVFSAAVAGISFRLFEAVFATLGWGFALAVVVIGAASFVFGPALVFGALGNLVGGIYAELGGE